MIYICTIIKNEHHYLREWLDYHLNNGFDKIILIEDYNSSSHEGIIKDLIEQDKVILIHESFVRGDRQKEYLNRNIQPIVGNYCLFTDIDEYIVGDIKQLCDKKTYLIKGICYGANNHIVQPKSMKDFDDDYKGDMNAFVNNGGYKIFAYITNAFRIKNIHGNLTIPRAKNIYYKHYYTKSLEDWIIKLHKGNYINYKYNIKMFFDINKEMLYNKDVENFIFNTKDFTLKTMYNTLKLINYVK